MEMLYLLIMLLMSAFALGTMAWDKRQARRGGWRVPERVLWAMAVLLGAPGEYLGMRAFRHKTLHLRFAIGLPLLSAAEILLAGYLLFVR